MSYHQEPPPYGWQREVDPTTQREFWVDTLARPPRSIWTHPYEDQQFLAEHPDVRQRLYDRQQPVSGGWTPPPMPPPNMYDPRSARSNPDLPSARYEMRGPPGRYGPSEYEYDYPRQGGRYSQAPVMYQGRRRGRQGLVRTLVYKATGADEQPGAYRAQPTLLGALGGALFDAASTPKQNPTQSQQPVDPRQQQDIVDRYQRIAAQSQRGPSSRSSPGGNNGQNAYSRGDRDLGNEKS